MRPWRTCAASGRGPHSHTGRQVRANNLRLNIGQCSRRRRLLECLDRSLMCTRDFSCTPTRSLTGEYSSTADAAEGTSRRRHKSAPTPKQLLLLLREQGARLRLQISSFSRRNYALKLSPEFLAECSALGLSIVHDVYPRAQNWRSTSGQRVQPLGAQNSRSRAQVVQERHTRADPMAGNRNLRRFNGALREGRMTPAVRQRLGPGVLAAKARWRSAFDVAAEHH